MLFVSNRSLQVRTDRYHSPVCGDGASLIPADYYLHTEDHPIHIPPGYDTDGRITHNSHCCGDSRWVTVITPDRV